MDNLSTERDHRLSNRHFSRSRGSDNHPRSYDDWFSYSCRTVSRDLEKCRDRSIININTNTNSNTDADADADMHMHIINNRNENANNNGINKYKTTKVSKVFLALLILCLKLSTSQTFASSNSNSNSNNNNKYGNSNLGYKTIYTPAVAAISARRLRLHDGDDRGGGGGGVASSTNNDSYFHSEGGGSDNSNGHTADLKLPKSERSILHRRERKAKAEMKPKRNAKSANAFGTQRAQQNRKEDKPAKEDDGDKPQGGGGGKDNGNGNGNGNGNNKNKNKEPTATPSSPPTGMPSFRPTGNPTASPSARPTASPSSRPTPSPSFSPTGFPTYHPTTDQPTILKGNPTPAPSRWANSFDGDFSIKISTLTADEDQLQISSGDIRKMRRDLSSLSTRSLERIYVNDISDGKHPALVEAVSTSLADILCKYTDFIILAEVQAVIKSEYDGVEFTDYCENDNEVIDVKQYYTKRDTVIIAPTDGNDLTNVKFNERKVYLDTLVGNYLYWIEWEINYPIVQVSKTIINQKEQNLDKALDVVIDKAALVVDQKADTGEIEGLLQNKNENILSAATPSYVVLESIKFVKDALLEEEEVAPIISSTERGGNNFFQTRRIAGVCMLMIFFMVFVFLIKAGKKRDDKVWESTNTAPMNGDLVSYEGVDFLLQSSQLHNHNMQHLSQPRNGHGVSNLNINQYDDAAMKNNNETSKLNEDKSSSTFLSNNFNNVTSPTVEHITTKEKSRSLFHKNKSCVTKLAVTQDEIEVSPTERNNIEGDSSFWKSKKTNNTEVLNKRTNSYVQRKMSEAFFSDNEMKGRRDNRNTYFVDDKEASIAITSNMRR